MQEDILDPQAQNLKKAVITVGRINILNILIILLKTYVNQLIFITYQEIIQIKILNQYQLLAEFQYFKLQHLKSGRLGHGKSSFCKMWVTDQQKQQIIAKTSTFSVTSKSALYKSDTLSSALHFQCYILDTPGLDSQESVSLIIEEIDEFVIKEKLQIIGIAYVLDIHSNREGQNGKMGYIRPFLNRLRLRYECKRNITFCVLSKFDHYFSREQSNQMLYYEFQKMFKDIGYRQIWNKRIQWMSEPAEDLKSFKKVIQRFNKQSYDQQHDRILYLLKQNTGLLIEPIQRYLSFTDYESDLRQYEKLLQEAIISAFPYKQETKILISFEFKSKQKQSQNESQAMNKITNDLIQDKHYGLIFFLTVSEVFLRGNGWLYKGLFSQFDVTAADSQSVIQREYECRISKKLYQIMSTYIFEKIKTQPNALMIHNSHIYHKVEYQYEGIKKKLKNCEKRSTKVEIKSVGVHRLHFTVHAPTVKEYDRLLQTMVFPKYNPL